MPLSARSVRPCCCRRAYVIVVFASDTTVPTTKAAATAGMRQAGFHGDLESRMLSWRKGILRSHGSSEEVPR